MLYVSTRNRIESFTSTRVLREPTAPDGGIFVPMQLQPLHQYERLKLYTDSFYGACAKILNIFFDMDFSETDVSFCLGRNVFDCHFMSYKIMVAELWHNPEQNYAYLEKRIISKLLGRECMQASIWVRTAIRTAVLFGVYTFLNQQGIREFNIAVDAADETACLAAYYARLLGLPVNKITLCCKNGSGIWDLIHKGEFPSLSGSADPESLIFILLGQEEVSNYLAAKKEGKTYFVPEEKLAVLNRVFNVSVVGAVRADDIIRSVYRSNSYIVVADTAAALGALQDYRARTGESRDTLVLSDRCPLLDYLHIQSLTGLTNEQLIKLVMIPRE